MKLPGRNSFRLFSVAVLAPLLAACASTFEADKSVVFDASSDKAIIVLGTSIPWYEGHDSTDESLTTHWHQYDPKTMRLVPDGEIFSTELSDAVWARGDTDRSFVRVLQIEPGNYALTAAGSRFRKSVFVRLKDGKRNAMATSYTIYPERFIDPEAPVDSKMNFLFSVAAGQIAYIGHFEFVRPHALLDMIVRIDYSLDEAAARAALKDYPGITGRMTTLNLGLPTESASR